MGLSLADHDPPPGVHPGRGRPHQREIVGDDPLALDIRAPRELGPVRLIRHALHFGEVLPQNAVARVRHPQCELAVVGEDDQTLRTVVEAADGKHALPYLATESIEHRRTAFGVVVGRDHAGRLVEQDVAQRLRRSEALAVDLDRIVRKIGLVAKLGRMPVDGDASLADPILRVPA
ncbi:MAG TPA: hypothetical protein PK435_08795 [Thermoanaerobaculaceae bacterium]|nr:hypothetical protein [Thermoanaerobaculaceae bacterium]